MRAGALRNVGVVQEMSKARDEYGAQIPVWRTVVPRIHFSLEAAGGVQKEGPGAVLEQSKLDVNCRYFEKIAPGMRIVFGERNLTILSVNDPTGLKRELQISVVEGMN